MKTALSAHAHEVLHQFLYIYIYILYIYVHEKPFCEERNIVDIVDPSSLRRTSHREFRHEHSSYPKIK